MEPWEGGGGGGTTPEPTAGLSCLPSITTCYTLRDSAPSPARNSAHRPTNGEEAAIRDQGEDGSLIAQAQASGWRLATSHPGRGGDNKSHQGTAGVGPEGGARCWSLGLGHTSCTWASFVRCAEWTNVHAGVVNKPMCSVCSYYVHYCLQKNLSFWTENLREKMLRQTIQNLQYCLTRSIKENGSSGDILLAKVSSHRYLEACSGASGTKTPQWKNRLVDMSVEMGLWARVKAHTVGTRGGDETSQSQGVPCWKETLKPGAPFQYS